MGETTSLKTSVKLGVNLCLNRDVNNFTYACTITLVHKTNLFNLGIAFLHISFLTVEACFIPIVLSLLSVQCLSSVCLLFFRCSSGADTLRLLL